MDPLILFCFFKRYKSDFFLFRYKIHHFTFFVQLNKGIRLIRKANKYQKYFGNTQSLIVEGCPKYF